MIRLDQLMMTVMVCVCVSGVAAELQAAVLSPMSQVQSTASGLCAADMARLPDTWSLSRTVQALMTCYLLTWSSCDCSAALTTCHLLSCSSSDWASRLKAKHQPRRPQGPNFILWLTVRYLIDAEVAVKLGINFSKQLLWLLVINIAVDGS